MKNGQKYTGAVVPLVTPLTAQGTLDEPALARLVDWQIAGGVDGIFVLGTTGEGAHVPAEFRRRLVAETVRLANKRVKVFAGLGDVRNSDLSEADGFFHAGADAVVAHPPMLQKLAPEKLLAWYQSLLDRVSGPFVIYNMPSTTGVSIPLESIECLVGHPNLAGVKDSENNPHRLDELLRRCGGRDKFSVFVGVGALMEKGMKLGADGVVPSVGNLIPKTCSQFCSAAKIRDWPSVEKFYSEMNSVASLYQKGRTLNESLAVLKAAMACRGLCLSQVLPPLKPLSASQQEKLRGEMERLHLMNGRS